MKKSFFIQLVVSALLVIVTIAPAFGAGKKKKKETPTHHDIVISNVTANSITVTNQKETRTFIVTPFAEINVNGQKGTIADLKSGMRVNVTIGIDPTHAGRIVASGPP